MRLLRDCALQLRYQVRVGDRMAELLRADCATEHPYRNGSLLVHDPHRGAVCAMRRASGTRLRRWPGAHGPALLYELGGTELHPGCANEEAGVRLRPGTHLRP